MEGSLDMNLTTIYLIGLVLIRAIEVVELDINNLRGKAPRFKHPVEDGRIKSLLAQYLSPIGPPRKITWWRRVLDGLAWLEPLAVAYFTFVAVRYEETRP